MFPHMSKDRRPESLKRLSKLSRAENRLCKTLSQNLSRCFRGHTFHFRGYVLCNDHFRFRRGRRLHLPQLLTHAYRHRDKHRQTNMHLRDAFAVGSSCQKLSQAVVPCVLAFARFVGRRVCGAAQLSTTSMTMPSNPKQTSACFDDSSP